MQLIGLIDTAFTGGTPPFCSHKLMEIEIDWFGLASLYPDCPFRRRSRLKDIIAFFCGGRYFKPYWCYIFPSEEAALHFAFLCKGDTPLISSSKEKWRFRHQIEAGYPSDTEIDQIPF